MKKLVYLINVDWYFRLHWIERALAAKESGYEVTVISNFTDPNNIAELESLGLKTIHVNIDRSGLNVIKEFYSLLRINQAIDRIKPDILHTVTAKSIVYGGISSILKQIPLVCSVTGLGHIFSNNSIKTKLLRFLLERIYRYISHHSRCLFLFENNDDLEYFVKRKFLTNKNTMRIFGSGVDCDLYYQKPELDTQKIVILCAARLLKDKGIIRLVEISKQMQKMGLSFEMHIAGIIDNENPNSISPKYLEECHQKGWIKWLGQIDDMPLQISKSHIAILPTTYSEGIPRFLIEAAACGRPIVTSNVAGCNEIVKHKRNGILADANDNQQFVEALSKLITSSSLRKKYGDYGRNLVVEKYSHKKIIEQTLGVYINLNKEN